MIPNSSRRETLLSKVPDLRAFAHLLCGNSDRADDLVQEALLSALAHIDRLQESSSITAWLFTILRNHFRSQRCETRPAVEDADRDCAERDTSSPGQNSRRGSTALRYALAKLPLHQREAVILVEAAGLSLQQAAEVCGCRVGTMRSRVNHARAGLVEFVSGEISTNVASA